MNVLILYFEVDLLNRNHYNDVILYDDGFVDISSGSIQTNPKNNDNNNFDKKPKNKKKIILISSIVATVVVVLGVVGFCVFGGKLFNNNQPEVEFTFAENTVVSGVSIAGKTMDEAKQILTENEANFIKPINITVNADDMVINLSEDDFEYTYDTVNVLNTVKNDAIQSQTAETTQPKTYKITAIATNESVTKNAKAIEASVNREPENAYVSKFTPYAKKRFEYADQVQGRILNVEDVKSQLRLAVDSVESNAIIKANVEMTDAEIQIDDIKKNVKKLASYETVSYNTANGTSNMKLALEACNGSVIEPGDTWSFNDCTGDSNLESNGYKAANVIIEGELTPGIGGGICQASSTIYNAGIRANMGIEERYAHLWASNYVPTGLDATIDYPRLDLKLSNPTKYQMFMECKVVNTTLYVSIWGAKDGDYDEIKTENKLEKVSSDSYKVRAWRVYFKKKKVVDKEELPSSTYDDANGIVFSGAEYDSNAVDRDVDDLTEPPTTEPVPTTEPPTTIPETTVVATKPTQKPTQATKPTEKPTQATTEPSEFVTEPTGVEIDLED